MEEGSLRCDANISVRLKGENKLGTKTEVKNMNSFRNVEKAIEFEIERQIDILEEGERIVQQTLLWNADQNKIVPMRSKEEAHDYRYFPDPDLMPIIVDQKWKDDIVKMMPELPEERRDRFINQYSLPRYDADILTSSRELADYYESILKVTDDYKSASNWVMTEVLKNINDQKISVAQFPVSANNIGKLINMINENLISGKIAKDIFPEMLKTNRDPNEIVKEKNLMQITDTSEIENAIDKILSSNPKQVEEFLSGKDKVLGFFVGQIMKETKGKANPQIVNELLNKKLNEMR
jgi:aspartyl-tRNA(Asn)/glutamyl-tRNA(Gln) amidotransferase subunit B